jgi:hypothetical protein
METDRLEIARLYHRFGFGPRPGEFKAALNSGCSKCHKNRTFNATSRTDQALAAIPEPKITDLGQRPAQKTNELIEFNIQLRQQVKDLPLWWLDRLVLPIMA